MAILPVELTVRAIREDDLSGLDWAGSPLHMSMMAEQSLGLGTLLIGELERRIRDRGLRCAAIDVEDDNPRARALYERLGYVAYDRRPEAWDEQDADGHVVRHETMCTLMRKELPS